MSLRKLDGSLAGNLKAILSHYYHRMGNSRRSKSLKKAKELNLHPSVSGAASGKCVCTILHADNRSAFVFDGMFMEISKTHYVFFRFRRGCREPRNSDGRMAWTTDSVHLRRETCQLWVTYKPKDSVCVRDEYVPLSSLDLCAPHLKEDEALVIAGADKGKIVYPSHSDRKGSGQRVGLFCKARKEDRKKDAIFYAVESLTRVRKMESGPPE